ncbi:MAG: hypothetical protein OEZ59_12640 [Deltaproteobacteria bacterium]|nr:hypothetical protein [Deltaproteobacteria bacterium]
MVIHEKTPDTTGSGRYDLNTTRYIPVAGGSRSRLPIEDASDIMRYHGFVGIDEGLTESIFRMAVLYNFIGGRPELLPGQEGSFTELILNVTLGRLEAKAQAEGVTEVNEYGEEDEESMEE